MNKSILELHKVGRSFTVGKEPLEALKDVNLTVEEGAFISIVGHSGCGKSTLLKAVAGLLPYEGEILLRNRKVTSPGGECGVVFQDHRLLPWLRVRDNIAFGLHNLTRREREERAEQCLALVGLENFASVWPGQLSGGMSQRVAIARALAPRPKLLLLDEPFSALDALTRQKLQEELMHIWKSEGTTMLLVTHDIDEAIFLSQRVVVLSRRPGTVKADISVAFSGPRSRSSREFLDYKKQISSLLSEA